VKENRTLISKKFSLLLAKYSEIITVRVRKNNRDAYNKVLILKISTVRVLSSSLLYISSIKNEGIKKLNIMANAAITIK